VSAELQESFRLIRQHTTTPLAVGEVFNSIYDCQRLIQEQLIDYIRTAVVHSGGISHLRKIASLAEMYHVRTGAHGATDLSPVCLAAALHFDLSVSNFGIQEYMMHTNETDRVFPHTYSLEKGRCTRERRRVLVWSWTKRWRRIIRIDVHIADQPKIGRNDGQLVKMDGGAKCWSELHGLVRAATVRLTGWWKGN